MNRPTTIVNLFGGPGTGKSTTMAGLFARLKLRGWRVEMAHEWVKHPVWAGELHVLEDQLYILAKQNRQLRRLMGNVDVIVTDAPLLMSHVYGRDTLIKQLALQLHQQTDSLNIMLRRAKDYDCAGRVQTLEQASELDLKIEAVLNAHCTYSPLNADMHAAAWIEAQLAYHRRKETTSHS